jgi:hypothetical protein
MLSMPSIAISDEAQAKKMDGRTNEAGRCCPHLHVSVQQCCLQIAGLADHSIHCWQIELWGTRASHMLQGQVQLHRHIPLQ